MGISQEDIDNIVKDSADEGNAPDAGKDDIEVATRRKILEGFASHLSNIFAKLGVRDRLELAIYALNRKT